MSWLQGQRFSGQIASESLFPYFYIPKQTPIPHKMIYDFELGLISQEEYSLLRNIWEDMHNQIYRDIYADWLEDHHRYETAKIVREDGFVPGYGLANLKAKVSVTSGVAGIY